MGFRTAVLTLAVVVAALAGCSTKTTGGQPAPSTSTIRFSGGAVAPTNDAKIVVDGQQYKVDGSLACSSLADDSEVVIAIGLEPKAVKVTVSKGDSPTVKSAVMQNLIGYNLFVDPPQHGNATATKDGKTYTITGTVWGLDYRPGGSQAEETRPFEIRVTCP